MALQQPLNFSATVASSSSKELSNYCAPIRLGETRPKVGTLWAGFCDQGHVGYYKSVLGMRMSGKEVKSGKEKPLKEEEEKMKKTKKKQLKLLKGLSRDLSTFSLMGYGLDSDGAVLDQIRGNMITEARQVLLEQIQRLKAEEKESKRQMKEERARTKAAARMLKMSSSSSCSWSESEYGEVNMKRTKTKRGSQTPAYPAPIIPTIPSIEIVGAGEVELQPSNVGNGDDLGEKSKLENADDIGEMKSKKIEVCMGGKCKKAGAGALLEELKKAVGIQSVVSGCKCMGKCRDGPNLKLVNPSQHNNSVCVGVGLEDVNAIVSTFLGDQHLGFAAAT